MTTHHKLIAGAVVVVVLAGGGAAFAAYELSASSTATAQAVTAPYGQGIGSFGLGGGRLGGRGLGGGLGPGGGRQFRPGHAFGFFGGTSAAATYLGLSFAALRSDLQSGQTLAAIAQTRGKTVAGLVAAMVAAQQKGLDALVAAGRLTKAQEQQLEPHLKQRTTDSVNGVRPTGGFGGGNPPGATA